MSLPECRLVLSEHEREQAAELLSATESRFLASAGKLGGKASAAFENFKKELRDIAFPEADEAPVKATKRNVLKFFGAFGLAPTRTN